MTPHPARWWQREGDRFRCVLCPRECLLHAGQRAFCFVREATRDGVVLTTYGRSSGFCVDPIEKKPLHHYYPGSAVLSFGTAGCNLGCRYCQNWDISKAREIDRLGERASPADIANAARSLGCRSAAFTYNDPVVFAEYAVDTAHACREQGVHPVAVTAGYLAAPAREEFFQAMDAANIDLKAFSEEFYHRQCAGHLEPVLETIEYAVKDTPVWVELTTLLIPGLNDSETEIHRLVTWVRDRLGTDVPLHFTAFHPAYKMLDVPPTPRSALGRAREIAMAEGLRFVYTGNVEDRTGATTWCPGCGAPVVRRRGYEVVEWGVSDGRCAACGQLVAGHFAGQPEHFGSRRLPVAVTPSPLAIPPGAHESG